jgi:2',3'-cyclic-nucleotide 2'-phosphodiesterase (5'-nucleotidase family)
LGGLSKKAFQIKTITGQQQKPYLFVDSGNLLFKQAHIPDGPSQERLTAEGILKIYTTMKVDVVAVGPLDLAAGLTFLKTSQKQGFPWISANLLDHKGRPLFQSMRIKKIGKIKAGIIGLTGALSPLPAGVSLGDWRTVLPALVKKTSRQCDILILLSSLTPAENQEISQQFPSLHLIVANDSTSGNMNPQQINNTLITQTERQGKYQGILTIDWNKSGRWGMAREEELISLRNRIDALDWQIQRMRQRKDLQQPEYLQKIERIEKNRETVAQQIKTLEQHQPPVPGGKPPCSFSHSFLALQQSMEEAPEIKAIITGIKQQMNSLHRNQSRRGYETPLAQP